MIKLPKIFGIGHTSDDLNVNMKSALNEVSAAVMMVDRDFIVTYVNNASKKLFTESAEAFKKAFPDFNPDNIVGTCIDVFHRNPQHQRQLLADTSRLPFITDIKLGDLTINLYVTATYDTAGRYSGNVLEWRDVTEDRARAQKDLDNAGQLKAIEHAQGVVELSLDGKVLRINENFSKIIGYSVSEAIGFAHRDLVSEQERDSKEYINFWDKLRRGEFVGGRFKRIAKNGQEVWLEATYNPIFDVSGKPYKVVKYATDITQQVALEQESKVLALVANETDGSVLITDAEGKIEYVNKGFTNLTGYILEEVKGKKPGDFLQGKLTDIEAKKRIRKNLDSKQSFYEEILNYNKNGEPYWISMMVNPVLDKAGNVEKFISIQTNINDIKLKQLEYNLRLDAISRSTGIIEFTPAGEITYMNENFANVVGYTSEEVIGKHHRMFAHADYANSQAYRDFWQKLGTGHFDSGQYNRVGKNGNEIWLQATYNPIYDQEGNVLKVVKFATDITAQYQSARALEAAVEESKQVIELAKAGDLSTRVPLEGKTGAIASLCDGVNALIDKMTEVLISIREAGETINTAANEISTGNNDLSSRTEEQASSLEETASSMEELASTVKQNAENAKQANQMAEVASQVAIKGGEVVGNVVTTMSAINESARKIEDIITVIDGIAFQTNILALNAAVEAARAGEQGRGFAVVAGEVRNLAQRSATAAKEIKELISDSVSKVEDGTKLVENAGATMHEVVTSVQRVTDIMSEITAASTEQSAGIDQVNGAITNMDEVTQQNAALVEQAAAAAESLVEQAAELMNTVNEFKLNDNNANTERRKPNSPMRQQMAKPVQKASNASKVNPRGNTRTGTDNNEWEAF